MERFSQTLNLFETIKQHNLILEENATSGIVCGNFIHSMLYYTMLTHKYINALCKKWEARLPYSNLRCQIDWQWWRDYFEGRKIWIQSLIDSQKFSKSVQTECVSEDELSSAEFKELSTNYIFDTEDEQDMNISVRFKDDVLKYLRSIDTIACSMEDYLLLVSECLDNLFRSIDHIQKILKNPSAEKLMDFYDLAEYRYRNGQMVLDKQDYAEEKKAVPNVEFCAFAENKKQEYWQMLKESKFLDEKKKKLYQPYPEMGKDEDFVAYGRFLNTDGTLNKDAVSKYIYFSRDKLTDNQIDCFFRCYFMIKEVDRELALAMGNKDNGKTDTRQMLRDEGAANPVILERMLHYVDQLSVLVVPQYEGCMYGIWVSIFTNKQLCCLNDNFKASSHEKSMVDGFSKKFVCCIISFLWGKGFYKGHIADFVRTLEGGNSSHTVKNYFISRMSKMESCVSNEAQTTIKRYRDSQQIIEQILEMSCQRASLC